MDFIDLAAQCAPNVAPQTMAAIVSVESSHNPYAIGVVNGRLQRQPTTAAEAIATARSLERQGKNFSMGLAQVNRHNLPRYKISYEQVFEPCTNLRVGALILSDCYARALPQHPSPQAALRAAFSCYYSGNFSRGFRPDPGHSVSYVDKIVAASGIRRTPTVSVPAIEGASAAGATAPMPPARSADDHDSVLVSSEPRLATEDAERGDVAVAPSATPARAAPAEASPATPPKRDAASLVF